jgi:hypothetical protein
VVIKATQGETFSVSGLPAGTYGISYALNFSNVQGTRPDQTVSAGGTLTTDIPNGGVISIFAKTGGGGGNPCDLNGGGVNVSDVQVCANQAIGGAACTNGDIDHSGTCTVIDVQRVVNAALGGTCVSP